MSAAPPQSRCELLDRAVMVLGTHGECHGMCGGCIELWARLTPFPCEQRRWAVAVVERYESLAQAPDVRTNVS
jgi:hypothetical protein